MKLITKIKEIPKKKLAIIGILVVLILATVTVTYVASKRSNDASIDDNGADASADQSENTLSVFKPVTDESSENEQSADTTEPPETVPPIDLTGVSGMSFVSQGNGTCYIDGIGTCTDTELKIPAYSPSGDKVTRIGDGAFTNCTYLLSVTIPSTVKTIETAVFRGCSNLVSINVDADNSVYCSVGGVLMSKDKTVLICIPMNRPGTNYLLSMDIKVIAAYAFDGVKNLNNILYEGKISEFQQIDILIGNGVLDEIAITCNYVPAK